MTLESSYIQNYNRAHCKTMALNYGDVIVNTIKNLRRMTDAPLYMTSLTLHQELHIPTIEEETEE